MKDGMAFHRNAPRYFVVVDFRAKVFWQTGFLCINYSDSLPFRICLFIFVTFAKLIFFTLILIEGQKIQYVSCSLTKHMFL